MKYVIGNWKMNLGKEESVQLVKDIVPIEMVKTVVCPPYIHLDSVSQRLHDGVLLGAQNCSAHDNGACTSQISAVMIKGIGCRYVILGHSEVRKNSAEHDKEILAKAIKCQKLGLNTIVCIGETLEEYEEGKADLVVTNQLQYYLDLEEPKTIIAYEPVWAIGTGKVPTNEEIADRLKLIKELSGNKFPVLYGGSVNAKNCDELAEIENLDGFLVGGASLEASSFNAIIKSFKTQES